MKSLMLNIEQRTLNVEPRTLKDPSFVRRALIQCSAFNVQRSLFPTY